MLKNKTILITGATGSFGRTFTDYLLKNNKEIKKIIIFSRDELKQFQMQNEINKKFLPKIRFFLGDIRDRDRLELAFEKVDIVVHAAALKQVPAAEYNPFEFIKTNILGTQNIVDAALKKNVKNVIALSTDKAVAPVNLYGATKLCLEKLIISANNISGDKDIKFSVVRYGNVFGSRGSVYPHFKKMNNKEYFPITDKKMTRFNMSLSDSVKFVTWSLLNNIGGEIFIPKLSSYKIISLAKAIDPSKKLKTVGIRPGEKIHETLISESELKNTYDLGKYFAIFNNPPLKIIRKIKKNKIRKVKIDQYSSGTNSKFLTDTELKKIISNFEKNNDTL